MTAQSELMNPGGNPLVKGTPAQQRANGERIGLPFRPFRGGTNITTAMSAPTDPDKHCSIVGIAPRAEFVVRCPAGVTAFTIHYGRWVSGKAFGAAGTELDGWMEIGTVAVTGGTTGELFPVTFDTHTDPVGIWIDTITGTATQNFRMWNRGLPNQ